MKKLLRSLAIAMFATLLSLTAYAETVITVQDTIKENTIWSADTVLVTGDITIPYGVILTISPGVYVEFQSYFRIVNYGSLIALGATNDSITFTIKDTNNFTNYNVKAGGWGGIAAGQYIKLNTCIIRNIKIPFGYKTEIPIQIKTAGSYIKNCNIFNNISGISLMLLDNSNGQIELNNIHDNLCYHIKNSNDLLLGALAIIKSNGCNYNIINNNKILTTGIVRPLISLGNTKFDGNVIKNNFSGVTVLASKARISYCTFFNNSNNVIFIGMQSEVQFVNNQFYANTGNLGLESSITDLIGNIFANNENNISFQNSVSGVLVNNTFVNNNAPIYIESKSSPIFENNIIWGNNGPNGQIEIGNSQPLILNCAIQNGLEGINGIDYLTNKPSNIISKNPQFISPSGGVGPSYYDNYNNYQLQSQSPLVNKGISNPILDSIIYDIANNPRISNGIPDIGAFELHKKNIEVSGVISSDEEWIADTVIVINQVLIEGAKLIIAPKTTILFKEKNYSIFTIDGGEIQAIGDSLNPIHFIGNDQDTITNKSLNFFGSDTSIFKFCTFSNFKYAIYSENSLLQMNNCVFKNNLKAISLYNNTIILNNCLFYKNDEIGLYTIDGAVNNCQFFNNRFFSIDMCNSLINFNNVFANNKLIKLSSSNLYINCTFANNEEILFSFNRSKLINSIIWAINSNNIIFQNFSGQFINCLLNTKEMFPGNIYSKIPEFKTSTKTDGTDSDALKANWSLLPFSPCINAGVNSYPEIIFPIKDIDGNPRINNGKIDIGAYENQGSRLEFLKQPMGGGLCVGDSIVFMVLLTDTAQYQWQKDGVDLPSETVPYLNINNVNESNTASYQCKVSNSYGTVYSNSAILLVKNQPVLLSQTSSSWITTGNPFNINATVNGSNPLFFKWTKDGDLLENDTTGSIKIDSFASVNEGIYHCEILNSCGKAYTQNIKLNVAPQLINNNKNNACVGDTFELSVIFNDAATYKWLKDGNEIAGANSNKYSFVLSEGYSGNISCRVSNEIASMVTTPVFVQAGKAPQIQSSPQSGWYDALSSFTIEASANGTGPLTYQWVHGTNSLIDENSNRLKFAGFALKNEGIYYCKVSNTCGFDSSRIAAYYLAPGISVNTSDGQALICEKSGIKFTASAPSGSTFQWMRDGREIAGANSSDYNIVNASSVVEGNYSCKVQMPLTQTALIGPVLLRMKYLPVIEKQPADVQVGADKEAIFSINASGEAPITYQWFKTGNAVSLSSEQNLEISNASSIDEAYYYCKVSNGCGSISSNNARLLLAPQICLVTNDVDSLSKDNKDSTYNKVVWERNTSIQYHHFNVYRESAMRGYYKKIGEVPFNNTTMFVDKGVNPRSQAYVYKITASDNLGSETNIDQCLPHKTIHLLVTRGIPNGIQLDWDEYFGFDYLTYKVYRSINNEQFHLVHEQSSTSRTWTDFEDITSTQNLRYYVAVESPAPCDPRKSNLKAGSGPFVQAVSNMEDNRLQYTPDMIKTISGVTLSVSPNPFTHETFVVINLKNRSKVNIKVVNSNGNIEEIVSQANYNSGNNKIQIGKNLKPGVYSVMVIVGTETAVLRMVKL